ncbi:hypothetical protein COTS27_01182 [Spirochaetota bacterium]|nr:hypothetical protein COTS27_01182 [Spirochaetota bacterium]
MKTSQKNHSQKNHHYPVLLQTSRLPSSTLIMKIVLMTVITLFVSVMGKDVSFKEINIQKNKNNQALDGYDPVAYFTLGAPKKGSKNFQTEWKNTTWLFASQKHLDLFTADPKKYAPQYGGYCAWAIPAKEKLYGIDPDAWNIVDGKLYLNFNQKIKTKWEKNQAEFIRKGNTVWQKLLVKS